MEVILGWINETRIRKMGMTVIPCSLNIFIESRYGVGSPCPCTRLCPGDTVVKVVIDDCGRPVFIDLRSVQRHKAAWSGIHDVVLENIVRHVPLHLEFAGAGCRRIIFVESIVNHNAMIGVSPLGGIASNGNTRGMAVINKIVPSHDVTGGAVLVLAGQFDSEIHVMDNVLFDQDSGAAVHVDTIGRFIVAICRIAPRRNVVNQIAAHRPITRLVDGGVGRRVLKADDIDSDVVVVVDDVVRDAEVRDIPVHNQRLARTCLEVMHLIAVNDQVSDRSLGVGTVYSDAKSVATASGSIAARKSLFNVMDVVLQKLYVRASPHNTYPQRYKPMFGSMKVPNFKTLDPYVTLIVDGKYALPSRGTEVLCFQDRRFAWITSECDESITRVAGCIDAHEFLVDPTAHVDGAARANSIHGVLNGAPR